VLKTFEYQDVVPLEPEGGPRKTSPVRKPNERRSSFDEVVLGFDAAAALQESQRCLRCDVKERCAARQPAMQGAEV
jgi:hypothetical protein